MSYQCLKSLVLWVLVSYERLKSMVLVACGELPTLKRNGAKDVLVITKAYVAGVKGLWGRVPRGPCGNV